MACQIVATKGGVFALWGEATIPDMDRVVKALQRAVDECGHPVVYVTRLPVDAPPPNAPARAHLDSLMPNIGALCSSYHVVLEGEGFGAAIKRGVLTSMFQLGWRRKMFFVHATVEQVIVNTVPNRDQRSTTCCSPRVSRGCSPARSEGRLRLKAPSS